MTVEEIERNVAGIRAILENLLQPREGVPGSPPAILNNLVACNFLRLLSLNYQPFHFSPSSLLGDRQ